ncbi:MAG TPA: hypothetical protein VG502_17155 [Flexivirga sp.]|uniref:hypothetical protein n=1 Tax=Flexivirga sp. TaxID=1962927 RepID=UPI002B6E57BB|nr:hypothetical protein [Flexivirga sp.]HWC24027.1 hypothetical protein [Flexivirga sp.]
MAWILHLCAVGAFITLLTSAFRRGSEARLRTIACSAIMAGLAFTPAGWVVNLGMLVLMLSGTEFLYRPYYKVRDDLWTAFGCLAGVAFAGAVVGHFPWVFFPLACLVGLWALTGGPERNRRKHARHVQRKAFHEAAVRESSVRTSQFELNRLFNDPRLPLATRKNLHELLRRADALYFELRSHGASDRLLFEVEQIHEDFAPTAVRGYLALPPSVADTQPLQDGKTGAVLLDEQITIMHGAIDDIAAEARTHGAEGLLSSYRFLQDKFGHTDDELKL